MPFVPGIKDLRFESFNRDVKQNLQSTSKNFVKIHAIFSESVLKNIEKMG